MGEHFHINPQLLAKLNADKDLKNLANRFGAERSTRRHGPSRPRRGFEE